MTAPPETGGTMVDRVQDGLRRVVAVLDRVSARTETPRGRRVTLVISALVFIGAMALGLRGLPDGDTELVWSAIIATSVIGVPVLIFLNAVEYVAAGAVLGHRIAIREAMPIAIYSPAANLLPIPGAAMVRMQALKRAGSSYGRAGAATMAAALFWLAASLLVAALFLVPANAWLAAGALAGGVAAAGVGHTTVRSIVARRDDPPAGEAIRRTAGLLGVEVLMVIVRGVRYWLVMVGFDLGGSFQGAMLLPVAGVLASAIGFFPSGLGIREVISGALSRIAGDPASSGLLASGLDRLVSLPVLAAMALIMGVSARDAPATDPATPASDGAEPATGSDAEVAVDGDPDVGPAAPGPGSERR